MLAAPGASASVTTDLDLASATACLLPPEVPLCPVGHDPGSDGIGDDTVYATTVVENARITLEAPLLPSTSLAVSHNATYVDHPIGPLGSKAFLILNGVLPPEAKGTVVLLDGPNIHGTDGLWIIIRPYGLVPIADEDAGHGAGVPFNETFLGRDRFYPLGSGGSNPVGSDELVGFAATLAGTCLPEEAALPGQACDLRSEAVPELHEELAGALPQVTTYTGIAHAGIEVNPSPGTAAGVGSAREAQPATLPRGGAAGQELQGGDAGLPVARDVPSPPLEQPIGAPGPRPVGSIEAASRAVELASPPSGLGWWAVAGAALAVAVAMYRRIQRRHLLRHPVRKAVHDLVAVRPGLTIGEVAAHLGLSYKTLQHHAELLIEDAYLSVHVAGRKRRLFPGSSAYGPSRRAALAALESPSNRKILDHLRATGPLRRWELQLQTSLSRTAMWASLRDLERHGWVCVEGAGSGAVVAPAGPPGPPETTGAAATGQSSRPGCAAVPP